MYHAFQLQIYLAFSPRRSNHGQAQQIRLRFAARVLYFHKGLRSRCVSKPGISNDTYCAQNTSAATRIPQPWAASHLHSACCLLQGLSTTRYNSVLVDMARQQALQPSSYYPSAVLSVQVWHRLRTQDACAGHGKAMARGNMIPWSLTDELLTHLKLRIEVAYCCP